MNWLIFVLDSNLSCCSVDAFGCRLSLRRRLHVKTFGSLIPFTSSDPCLCVKAHRSHGLSLVIFAPLKGREMPGVKDQKELTLCLVPGYIREEVTNCCSSRLVTLGFLARCPLKTIPLQRPNRLAVLLRGKLNRAAQKFDLSPQGLQCYDLARIF